ncbi:glycosyltransferase [Streptomyces albus subsp. chlorinus]|uniref:glycosyltransferase family 2 protein n=1 Tax=Streptomyces albus TaxID=1888 RepID=UPI00157108BF|nr:glycosyltransferase family 2 protein [Streptomyces albus]NSC24003.1 glycosyltransferase [Streptomyces albus subsp. chlorinus]
MSTTRKAAVQSISASASSRQEPGSEQLKVSVVVPTYNTGEAVLTGLRSFLAQTMPRSLFEVVYVDDGSSDETVALLEAEIARQGAQETVRVLRAEHSGWPGRPRNIGTDAARGEFVHYVDDDDHLAPEALERTYARACETGADIVIGRMAGHGRKAPRALFEKPLTSSDLRTDTTLLASMTVHKLFRRSFLDAHGLRFPEGRVRLEDHMFTLRAFLLTDRVATVHDYTCYHWVRHTDGKHNVSYTTIEPGPYVDSVRKVLAILDAPDTQVPPGRHRHRLAAKWYGNKALDRVAGKRLLDQPPERRAAWIDAVGALAAGMPPEADAALPTRLRVVAALARHGDRALLEELAAFEAGIVHRPKAESARWRDGRLQVRCSSSLVRRRGRGRGAVPLVFQRPDGPGRGRLLLRLPPRVAAVSPVADAADFARAVRRSNVRGQLRHRESGTVLNLPATWRVTEEPVTEDVRAAGGRLRRLAARAASLLRGRRRRPGALTLRYEAEFTVDPATADHGHPLAPGTWDLRFQLGVGGWRTAQPLPGHTLQIPDRAERPAPAAGIASAAGAASTERVPPDAPDAPDALDEPDAPDASTEPAGHTGPATESAGPDASPSRRPRPRLPRGRRSHDQENGARRTRDRGRATARR